MGAEPQVQRDAGAVDTELWREKKLVTVGSLSHYWAPVSGRDDNEYQICGAAWSAR